MASSDLDLNQVAFQNQLRSKPVKLNFTDIENNFNALRAEVYASIASTASEITSARDNFGNLTDNIHTRRFINGNGYSFGGAVGTTTYITETTTPSMKLHVAAGEGVVNGVGVDWSSATSGTLTAPASGKTRIDIAVVNTDNTISVVSGGAATTAQFPSVAVTQYPLTAIYLTAGTTELLEDRNIIRLRDPKNPYYPNVLLHSVPSAGLLYNNIIVDMATPSSIDIEAQGFVTVSKFSSSGANGSGESTVDVPAGLLRTKISPSGTAGIYTIANSSGSAYDSLVGSVGAGISGLSSGSIRQAGSGSNAANFNSKSFSLFVRNIDLSGGYGTIASTTETEQYVSYPALNEKYYVGSRGGDGGNGGSVVIEVVSDINVSGTITTNGGDGGDGTNASSGTEANLGGIGGIGADSGAITMTAKTINISGTIARSAGSGGAGGTGSGGTDNNGNGSAGANGSSGTRTETIYDFTSGLPSDYSDWIKPII